MDCSLLCPAIFIDYSINSNSARHDGHNSAKYCIQGLSMKTAWCLPLGCRPQHSFVTESAERQSAHLRQYPPLSHSCGPFTEADRHFGEQNHRVADMERGLWRQHSSKSLSKTKVARPQCSRSCPVAFCVSPRMETP